jgi:hypothetical protein
MIGPRGMEAGIDPGRARAKIACPCQGMGGGTPCFRPADRVPPARMHFTMHTNNPEQMI